MKRIHGYTTHKTQSPEYRAYTDAQRRCQNQNSPNWEGYGGRGIRVKFTSFLEFLSEIGPRPGKGFSLDRINNNGHYESGNVRWATASEQQCNRRKWTLK